MAITDKLNDSWNTSDASRAVFEVRAAIQNLSNVAIETKSRIDIITGSASFDSVDAEIKAEGATLIGIVNSLNNAFANHNDFINWTQP